MAPDSTASSATDGRNVKFRYFRSNTSPAGVGRAIGVLVSVNMTTNEEPEPLELGRIRRVPNAAHLGCCALFRKFQDKDAPGALTGWTCLAIPKTPYGQALNQMLQNELGSMQLTHATHFLVFPCSSEIELAAVHHGLCKKYQPVSD